MSVTRNVRTARPVEAEHASRLGRSSRLELRTDAFEHRSSGLQLGPRRVHVSFGEVRLLPARRPLSPTRRAHRSRSSRLERGAGDPRRSRGPLRGARADLGPRRSPRGSPATRPCSRSAPALHTRGRRSSRRPPRRRSRPAPTASGRARNGRRPSPEALADRARCRFHIALGEPEQCVTRLRVLTQSVRLPERILGGGEVASSQPNLPELVLRRRGVHRAEARELLRRTARLILGLREACRSCGGSRLAGAGRSR